MQPVMVVGCSSLEWIPSGVRVLHETEPVSIAWHDVSAAALAGKDRQTMPMYEGMAALRSTVIPAPGMPGHDVYSDLIRKVGELETHHALLIVHRSGMVCALIEQSGPEREALLAAMRKNLGDRWFGEDFTSEQLKQRFDPDSSGWSLRGCSLAVKLFGWAALMMVSSLLGVVILAIPGAALSTGFGAFLEALFRGDWKAALIAGTALAAIVLVFLGVKKMAGSRKKIRRGRFG